MNTSPSVSRSAYQTTALTVLRIGVGIFFVVKGIGKIGWIATPSLLGDRLNAWLQHATAWNEWYVTAVIPAVPVLARLVVLGELGGGLAITCGVWTRPIAALTLFMVLNFHVATAAVFEYAFLSDGTGLPLVAALLALVIAGPSSGLESLLMRRSRIAG
jgi:uncharacterized membrane protein YphA (DoxX/SURF4 family)